MTVTRFAPSPTGLLHLGHAFAAIMAEKAGDRFLLRIEDIDTSRLRAEFVDAIYEDLHWLGLRWEEPVLRQSTRGDAYRTALNVLEGKDLLYPCFCTRKEIADEIARASEAPHFDSLLASQAGPDGPIYPGTCRHLTKTEREERIARGEAYALRLDAAKAATLAGPLTFSEHGEMRVVDPLLFGDVVLARKDIPAAYHLAVVVDDAHQGVTLVTRGEDLLPAVHIQRVLQAVMDLPEPAYAHHRLILDANGKKFSKRDGAVTLRSLRAEGLTPFLIRLRLGV
ncbi:MAG TPA: tRNA glutamyl-Q(34) synthetase GluQRS [Rhizomicrobium sp.]|nr:tRNA glutamyl-Q(34) synthetase GluQRS [Rhizomicrobium sp.]